MFISTVKADPYQNVIQFTLGRDTTLAQRGDRYPAVWIQGDKQIAIAAGKYWDTFCCVAEQKWTKIEISQTLVDWTGIGKVCIATYNMIFLFGGVQ